jgi:hypothetical protein
VETFVNAGAIVQLQPISDSATIVEMANLITELLADPTRRYELGVRARNLVDENRGATARTIESLSSILTGPKNAAESVALAANGNPKA